jgi:hypothetical protein
VLSVGSEFLSYQPSKRNFYSKLLVTFLLSFSHPSFAQKQAIGLSGIYQNQDIFTSLFYSRNTLDSNWTAQISTAIGTRRLIQNTYLGRYQLRVFYNLLQSRKIKLSPWVSIELSHFQLPGISTQKFYSPACLSGIQLIYGQRIQYFVNGGLGYGLLKTKSSSSVFYRAFATEFGLRYVL